MKTVKEMMPYPLLPTISKAGGDSTYMALCFRDQYSEKDGHRFKVDTLYPLTNESALEFAAEFEGLAAELRRMVAAGEPEWKGCDK